MNTLFVFFFFSIGRGSREQLWDDGNDEGKLIKKKKFKYRRRIPISRRDRESTAATNDV